MEELIHAWLSEKINISNKQFGANCYMNSMITNKHFCSQ